MNSFNDSITVIILILYLNSFMVSAEAKSSGKKKKGSSYQTISATHRVGKV